MSTPRLCLALLLGLAALPAQQPAPRVLQDQVPCRELAAGQALQLGGRACLSTTRFDLPYLVWDLTDHLPIRNDADSAVAWLRAHARELGHGAFTPVPAGTRDWNGDTVRIFSLERDGVRLDDAEIWVCFDADGCLGLVNRVPPGLDSAPAPGPEVVGVERCYKVQRARDDSNRVVVATVRRTRTPTHELVDFVVDGTAFGREHVQRVTVEPDSAATVTEYFFGGFPDQLQADARGVIWCSDPSGNRILEIDPQTGSAIPHSTLPWRQPDGLCVDPNGRVWTGLYTSGNGLGLFDRNTNTFTRFPVPPGGGSLAIPTWHHNGSIYVTQHSPARLHEFVVATSTWQPSVILPGAWPVSATYDSTTGDMFVMQYQSNSIARIADGGGVSNLPTPQFSGPSFSAAANGKVWFSYWNSTQIGELDVATGTMSTFTPTISGAGGPIDVGPNGHVYLGTRNTGYIIEYDPVAGTTTNHLIPSGSRSLKDGLTVAPDGTVWFTSSGTGRVVRMTLP